MEFHPQLTATMPARHEAEESNVVLRTRIKRFMQSLFDTDYCSRHHASVFFLTFISFALLHAARKTLSTVKPSLIHQWTRNTTYSEALFPDKQSARVFLAFLDGGFLAAYAIGLYVGGVIGDRFNQASVIGFGMCSSSIAVPFFSINRVFMFGTLTQWLKLYSKAFYAITWICGGFLQSVVWPNEISVMGNWFGYSIHGAVFGIWSACASVGNIIGTEISAATVEYGYELSFGCTSSLLFFGGLLVFGFLKPSPAAAGVTNFIEHEDDDDNDDIMEVRQLLPERLSPINFLHAWLLPGVISYSLAYACLKVVNYSFFFWLPLYLHNNFGWPEAVADNLSIWYDGGGILSAIVAGIASDYCKSRTPFIVGMLTISMGALFAYANSPKDVFVNSLLMACTGFFIGGPSNLISSAVSADLGKAREIRNNVEALSTVTGIIDGTGSIGASIGQLLLPIIQNAFGWIAVFYSFILMIFFTIVCLLPLLWKETRENNRFHRSYSDDGENLLDESLSDEVESRSQVERHSRRRR